MSEITFQAPDGGKFTGYIATPPQTPAPTVLVIQEIFGVNQVMRDICDWLAGAGYLACCPDIFWRIEPGVQLTDQTDEEWQRAFALMQQFDIDKGVEDLKAALSQLRSHDNSTGKAGVIGYCLGGKLAFLMATRSDSDASVSYYGVGLDELLGEIPQIRNPLLMHMASKDSFVPPDAQRAITDAVSGNALITLHVYEGNDHAFAREGGAHYDPDAAALANRRSLAFLAKNLT